jgi:hypothetical protein
MKTLIPKALLLLLALAAHAHALSANLTWNPNPPEDEVTRYEVRYGTAPGTYTQTVSTTTTGAKATNLLPGVTYYFVVVAFNAVGESPPSDEVSKAMPPLPSKPAGVRVVEIEVSLDLKEWKTIAYVPLVDADANSRFIRSRLATVSPAGSP